jgi:hypothetical protein
MMWRRRVSRSEAIVCDVGNCFCGSAKDRRTIFPAHRENERESQKGLLTGARGKDEGQFWDVGSGEVDPIKTVAEIRFREPDGAKGGVRKEDFAQDAIQCMPELHGIERCVGESVVVDIGPAVIPNPTGPTVTLGDDTGWRCTKMRQRGGNGGREDDPLTLVDHVDEFLLEEVNVVEAGTMRATADGGGNLVGCPRRRAEVHWGPSFPVKGEQASGRMVDGMKVV